MNTEELNQYLTFMLDRETFALGISTVREVLELLPITHVPGSPDYLRGVISLRGHAVPVVDLRGRFHMPKGEDTVETCIIIAEVDMGGESLLMGAVADSVCAVVELPSDSLEPAPRMGAPLESGFIHGMGRQGDDFVIILDINHVFGEFSMAALAQAHNRAGAEATGQAA